MTAISNLRTRGLLGRALPVGAVLVLAGLAAGCSSTSSLFGSSDSSANAQASDASTTDRLSALVFGPPARPGEGVEAPKADLDCPSVDIRQGASTLTVAPPTRDASAAGIRYQASIGRTARDCALAGGTMSLRVGVQGRIVLGPAGGPGQLDIPIRYAVVQEGVEPKTVETKLHRLSVKIEPGQANVPFTHVAEDLRFAVPNPNALGSYVIYVGFDAQAPREERKPRQQRRTR
jgi:hypothetical protein